MKFCAPVSLIRAPFSLNINQVSLNNDLVSVFFIVSFAAVVRVVTQRFSSSGGEPLRDDPNNGCEGEICQSRQAGSQKHLLFENIFSIANSANSDDDLKWAF